MTLRYKFLGSPQTLEEFIDNAVKSKIEKVTISIGYSEGKTHTTYRANITDGEHRVKLADKKAEKYPNSDFMTARE